MSTSLIFFFIIIALNFFLNKSKMIYILSNCFLFILMAYNDLIADRIIYKAIFMFPQNYKDVDFGFLWLVRLANLLGINFQTFINIVIVISLFLIAIVVLRISSRPGLVLIMYTIFPFFNDAAQIRSFLGMALILNGVYHLFFSEKKSSKKFIFFWVLATSVHYTFIFLFFLIFLKDINDVYKAFRNVIISVIVIVAAFPIIISIVRVLIPPLWIRISKYFELSTSVATKMGLFVIFGLTLILILFFISKAESLKIIDLNSKSGLVGINLFMLAIFPLVFYSVEFLRIYRSLFIFNYVLFSNSLFIRKRNAGLDAIFLLILVLYFCILYYYFDYVLVNDSIITPMFENNLIIPN